MVAALTMRRNGRNNRLIFHITDWTKISVRGQIAGKRVNGVRVRRDPTIGHQFIEAAANGQGTTQHGGGEIARARQWAAGRHCRTSSDESGRRRKCERLRVPFTGTPLIAARANREGGGGGGNSRGLFAQTVDCGGGPSDLLAHRKSDPDVPQTSAPHTNVFMVRT